MKKQSYTLLSLLILAGCAVSDHRLDEAGIFWRPYFENDGSLQEISYVEIVQPGQSAQAAVRRGQHIGEARRKVPLEGDLYTQELIGPVYASGIKPNDVVISTIMLNGDTQQPVSMYEDDAAMAQLRQAHNITVYTQGEGILETIRYQSQTPICTAFEQGDVISVRSVTNYYESDKALLATVIESKIDRNDYRITKQDILRHNYDADINNQDVSKTNQQDVAKQVRILAGEICGIQHHPKFNPSSR
ncbi:hypothetical protein KRX19_02405 [Cardiobacteriaceae bacterium TAE3-ERU3]|nr:hypothetical protein [Cardiobacteriaceae bacterium TAE3-ERU3]